MAVITYTQIKTFSQLKVVLHRLPSRFEPWLTGLALGLTAALAMTLPLAVAPGVIVDGSTVPIGLAAPVGGPIAGIIAALLAVVYRLSLGGAGSCPACCLSMTMPISGAQCRSACGPAKLRSLSLPMRCRPCGLR